MDLPSLNYLAVYAYFIPTYALLRFLIPIRAPWIVKRCREGRRRTNEDDSVMPEDFDGAEAELIQQSIRRTLEGGILFPTDTRRMSLEDRREYIANVLLSKVRVCLYRLTDHGYHSLP